MGNCTSLKKHPKKNLRSLGKLSLSTTNITQNPEPCDFRPSSSLSLEIANKAESPQTEICKTQPSKKKYFIALNSDQEEIQPIVSNFDDESL